MNAPYTLLVLALYFVPSIVALARKNVPHAGSVIVVNLFLGWTFIGWIVALAMACRSPMQAITVNAQAIQIDSGEDKNAT